MIEKRRYGILCPVLNLKCRDRRCDKECLSAKTSRSFLGIMVAALVFVAILGLAYHAYASTPPRIEPEKAKDAQKSSARCIQITTVQRFLMKPDGTMLPISGRVTLLAGC